MFSIGRWDQNIQRASPPKTEPLPQRNGLLQHVRTWGETILLLPCKLIQMASSNRLYQRGSTKLAGHQNSSPSTGSAASQGARSHSNQTLESYICPNQQKSHWESNVKWQNMTKDYIISISGEHQCAAVDLGISILLLPPAVLHNKADNSRLGNQQSATERVKLAKAPSNWRLQFHQRRTKEKPNRVKCGSNSRRLVSPFWLPEWSSRCFLHHKQLCWGCCKQQLSILPSFFSLTYFTSNQGFPTWRLYILSEPWAFLRSSASFENQSRPKQSERKKLETSSRIFSGQSWGQGHLPQSPWSWMTWCRLPWSRHPLPSGCLEGRCNPKHELTLETSHPWATCMCLTKNKAKENGHCQKNAKAFDDYLAKEGCLEDPFQNKSSGTINPVYLPRKLLNTTKNVSIKKTLSITNLAHDFYPATYEDYPMNNNDLNRGRFLENVHWKEMHQLLHRTWRGMILKGWNSGTFTCY